MVKGVIFDMDGTMFDTERMSTGVWEETGKRLGIEISEDFIDTCSGKTADISCKIFKAKFGQDFDYDRARMVKNEIFDALIREKGVSVKKGLFELLDYLKSAGIPMAVATSTAFNRASVMLKSAGVYDYFTDFMYGDMLTASKPEPDIFIEAAKKLGLPSKECLVIEDSTPGLLAGKAAGGYVIYVPDVVSVPNEVKEGITAEMEDLSGIIDWIKKENDLE